ncbi:MAG: ribose-5-phosphate isomerase [Actinomycetota bacterium]|nr:MAG: ribose-5-phosphate isomerase [Actinomycetota bacterium]
MWIHIGSDHAGFALREAIAAHLAGLGHEVVDHGPYTFDPDDDYPSYCIATAAAVLADTDSLGFVIGGSGNGEQIAANRVRGIRAALVWSVETAQLAREHNDAQIAAIGARMHDVPTALTFVDAFVDTPFSKGERHRRRIAQLDAYEATH